MTSRLDIWLVTIGEPLPLEPGVRKLRTGIVADLLASRGHRVRWWVSAFEHQRKKMLFDADQEVRLHDNLRLQILRGCGYRDNISLKRYIDHRIIARKFRRFAPMLGRPDVVVAAMPCHHLAYEAVRYAKTQSVPVVVDVRDLWPDIFVEVFRSPTLRSLAKVLLFAEYKKLKFLLKQADSVMAMSSGVLRWALSKSARPVGKLDRVFYLGYKRTHYGTNETPAWLDGRDGQRLVVYVGTFGASYELSLMVSAARKFHEAGRDEVCFVLAGVGEQENKLQMSVRDLPNVVMPGWIQAKEIISLLDRASVGVIPCRSVIDAMPNKTFEYLSAGLPVVSSLEGEMADTISKFNMGLNYRPGDEKGLYEAIKTIIDDPALMAKMSANALNFFSEQGDADKIYSDYADHIEKICETAREYAGGENTIVPAPARY